MKTALTLLLSLAAIALTQGAYAASDERHTWRRIEYPPIPVPGLETGKVTVLVGSGDRDEVSHLRFDVLWNGRGDAPLPAVIADPGKIVVRMHLSDGEVILPPAGRRPSWIGAGSGGITYSLIHTFPWQRNVLEEAWIELVLAGQSYWVELPYGFTRNPADPLAPDDATRGKPAFPPTMAKLGEGDRLVPWLDVNYDLGKIQNDGSLSLALANPFDAQAEVTLYRDSSGFWDLHTPRTAMEIKKAKGGVLAARAMGIRLHGDGMRRSDSYAFSRGPGEGRDWGRVVIKVDEETYECVVPSSLFKYVHGVTDHGNTRRLPRPAPLRDR